VLPIGFYIKKIAIMYMIKKFHLDNNYKELNNKREMRKYDLTIKFANKSFGQRFVDYQGPNFFNSMPYELKKKILGGEIVNIKGMIYKHLFLELDKDVR